MKFTFISFIIWKFFLTIISFISIKLIPLKTGYLGGGTENYLKNPLIWGWSNMDGVHYLSIAQNGYFQFEQAFFPLYPLMIRFLSPLFGGNFLLTALIISNLCFLSGLYFFYKLLEKKYSKNIARWGVVLLLAFPASFFFSAVYTESLFFLLTVLSFYFMEKNNYYASSFFGIFASAARLVGIFLFPALLLELWRKRSKDNKLFSSLTIKDLFPIMLIPIGLLSYMRYLYKTTGDALFFFHAQPAFGAGRSGSNIILLPQVIYRYFKIFTSAVFSFEYLIAVLEMLSFLFTVFILIRNFKKINISYILFIILIILIPTLTGTLSSMPRYIMNAFPFFILLSLEKKKIKIGYLTIGFILLMLSTMFFFRGYFVS